MLPHSRPTRRPGAPASPEAAAYLDECGRDLWARLPDLLEGLFAKVDDALYELADRSGNNRLYTLYFDAMRVIRTRQREVQLGFLTRLRQGVDQGQMGDAPPGATPVPAGSQDPAPVPAGESDAVLALSDLVTRAESRYRRQLTEMGQHLGGLMGRQHLKARANPLGPFAICEAFREALGLTPQIDSAIRVVVYGQFGRQVMDCLGPFYDRCVDLAVAGGHAPGAGLVRLMGRAADAADGHGTDRGPPLDPASVAEGLNLPFETLCELLDRQRPSAVPRAGDRVQTAELLAVLGDLDLIEAVREDASPGALRGGLTAALARSSPAGRELTPTDQHTLDLVLLFFEHLLEGNDLPDALKVLIGRMQIPVAKLALLDKGFFSDPNHPARRLLNRLGGAAIGWSEDDGRGRDSLYGMIERVIDRLILDFDGDPTLFNQMDRFFVAYIAREREQADAFEAQAVAKVAGRLGDAEVPEVAAALAECLRGGGPLPQTVDAILRAGWQPAITRVLHTEGVGSPAWNGAVELAQRLIWSVQPKTEPEERRQLLRRIPEILRAMRALLTEGGCDQRQLARWFRELQTLHLGVLQGEPAARAAAAATARGVGLPAAGDWVELEGDGGRRTRLKVSWVSPDGGACVLVDRRGRRGREISGHELRRLLSQGQARLLGAAPEPIADRALRSVVTDLVS